MEAGKMEAEAQQSRYFFERLKKVVLKIFGSTKDYRFESYSPFLTTTEGIEKHVKEVVRLESEGYFSSDRNLDQLIQQTSHERDLIQNSQEALASRTRIYFSLAAIIAIIAIGIINGSILITRIQDHLMSDFPDWLITLVSLGTLLYLILMSISALSLALRNYSSVWSRYTKLSLGGFKIAKVFGISGQAAINIEQYTIAKAVEYNTKSTAMANIYWRVLLSDSIERLVGTVIMSVFFSLYLAFNNPEPGVQIVYGSILLIFLTTTLIRDRIDVLYLIRALYKPIKKIDREIRAV